jgi:hypothetical protein
MARAKYEEEQPLELQVQGRPTTAPQEEKPVEKPQVNIPLLKAVSTAVWKLSLSPEARDRFRQLGIVRIFIRHLNQPTEEVQTMNTFKHVLIKNHFSYD